MPWLDGPLDFREFLIKIAGTVFNTKENISLYYISFELTSKSAISNGGRGSFNNYVDRILPFFDPPLAWTVFIL